MCMLWLKSWQNAESLNVSKYPPNQLFQMLVRVWLVLGLCWGDHEQFLAVDDECQSDTKLQC